MPLSGDARVQRDSRAVCGILGAGAEIRGCLPRDWGCAEGGEGFGWTERGSASASEERTDQADEGDWVREGVHLHSRRPFLVPKLFAAFTRRMQVSQLARIALMYERF